MAGISGHRGGGIGPGESYVIYGGTLGGSTTPVTASGDADPETLVGGAGNDALSGGGGADVICGGAGDDTVAVGDLTFRKVDGGSGTDTLAFAGTAETIDLTTASPAPPATSG